MNIKSAREEWKEIRPQIGQFICELDNLYKGAEDIDEAISQAEQRGYSKGYADATYKEHCKECKKKDWYDMCNGHFMIIQSYLSLSNEDQAIVRQIILRLLTREGN